MKGERVSTEEAAWVMGSSAGWVREKMRMGQLPIGIYSKNGAKANPVILLGPLAEYLRMDRDELRQQIEKMRKEKGERHEKKRRSGGMGEGSPI